MAPPARVGELQVSVPSKLQHGRDAETQSTACVSLSEGGEKRKGDRDRQWVMNRIGVHGRARSATLKAVHGLGTILA